MTWFTRLKARWGVSTWGIIAILLSFSIAGTAVLKIGRIVVDAIVPSHQPRWLWWLVKIVVVVPIYEVLLITTGTLLGQRRFFVDKQKRLFRLLKRAFQRRQPAPAPEEGRP